MAETLAKISVAGSPLSADDLDSVQSVSLEEAMGQQGKVSITVQLTTSDRSAWTSCLDPLVSAAAHFHVSVTRESATFELEARSVSASWHIEPGGTSTLTVEGLDLTVEMDRRDIQRPWNDTNDAAIAETILGTDYHLATNVDHGVNGPNSNTYSQQQGATDWHFLRALADRNGYDVYVESVAGVATGFFRRVDVNAAPQATLKLGYGDLGGRATAQVNLVHGQEVHVTRVVPGTTDTDVASDDGHGHAMGARSLGGYALVRTHGAGTASAQDAQWTARALAERSAFGASLNFSLTSPDAPLIRARRTITIAGLGEILDGLWLVKSVRHTVTQAGHTQTVGLVRNALGPTPASLAGAGVSL